MSERGKYAARIAVRLVREGRATAPRARLNAPDAAARFAAPLYDGIGREHFYALHLNTQHEVLSYELVTAGTLDGSLIGAREVFQGAILANARAVMLVHNHPSGDPTPSPDDYRVTMQLVEAGRILGIPVIDHIVIGENGRFSSMSEKGIIPR